MLTSAFFFQLYYVYTVVDYSRVYQLVCVCLAALLRFSPTVQLPLSSVAPTGRTRCVVLYYSTV